MKRILILLCCLPVFLQAQIESSSNSKEDSIVSYTDKTTKEVLQAIIVEGDTIPIMVLDEVLLVDKPTFSTDEARRRYYILRRKVIKVYPYAVIAGNKLDSLNLMLAKETSRWKRSRLIKDYQEFLEDRFEEELKKLTHSEGQILSKLIYRETGMTSYDLISEYRSGFRAFAWNIVANFNKISLKTPYKPLDDEEDKLIEAILQRSFINGLLKERVPITKL
jgi:hypothetical protein